MATVPNIPSNLNPTQLSSLTSQIPTRLPNTGSLNNLTGSTAVQADKLKDLANDKLASALPVNPAEIVKLVSKKNDKTATEIKKALLAVVTPLLAQFLTSEAVINRLISTTLKAATKTLNQKGKVEIQGLSIVFTPLQPGNYEVVKQNFDNKVNNLKKAISSLKKIVDAISTILIAVRAAIAAIKVIRAIIKNKKKTLTKTASVELNTISPVKPSTSAYLVTKEEEDDKEKDLDKKLEAYADVLDVVSNVLIIFRSLISKIQLKLNEINLTINNQPPQSPSTQPLVDTFNTTPGKDSTMEETYANAFGNYTLKVESLLSGAIQATAYDKFSNLPITRTAPSKTKAADKLLDELKQILG